MAITVPRRRQLFIDGQWTEPVRRNTLPVVNPATEDIIGTFSFPIKSYFGNFCCFASFDSIHRYRNYYAFPDLLYT